MMIDTQKHSFRGLTLSPIDSVPALSLVCPIVSHSIPSHPIPASRTQAPLTQPPFLSHPTKYASPQQLVSNSTNTRLGIHQRHNPPPQKRSKSTAKSIRENSGNHILDSPNHSTPPPLPTTTLQLWHPKLHIKHRPLMDLEARQVADPPPETAIRMVYQDAKDGDSSFNLQNT